MKLFDVARRWGPRTFSRSGRDNQGKCATFSLPGGNDPQVQGLYMERYRLDECIDYMESDRHRVAAFDMLLGMYRIKRRFPDLSNFRLGPNMFKQIPVDWIVLAHGSESLARSQLIAHGLACRIPWNGNPRDLPKGWQGAVRACYENFVDGKQPDNTFVGLFIKVENDYRKEGWAAQVVAAMKKFGAECGASKLIIPLRLPTRYERQYFHMPFEEFAVLRQATGEYRDHWLRLHVQLGAEIIGYCSNSHQYAMNVNDFYAQFEAEKCETSGYQPARRNNEWHNAYVDLERDCVVINEGCVWVQHTLEARS